MGTRRKAILWMLTVLAGLFLTLFVLGGIGTVELTLFVLALAVWLLAYLTWGRTREHTVT